MTGNRNAINKEEINEGEVQIASVSTNKIINDNNFLLYIETMGQYTSPQPWASEGFFQIFFSGGAKSG